MRRSQRLIAATMLISFCTLLAGCSSSLDNLDPTDLFDWLNTKKPLPGTRQPVFPNGVPGVEEGVPKDLYKSAVEQRERQDQAAEAAAVAAAAAPTDQSAAAANSGAGAAGKQSATARTAAAETARGPVRIAPEPEHKKRPKHKKRKLARKRVATPQPAQSTTQYSQQPAQAAPMPASEPAQSPQPSPPPFPAPLPSGSFTR